MPQPPTDIFNALKAALDDRYPDLKGMQRFFTWDTEGYGGEVTFLSGSGRCSAMFSFTYPPQSGNGLYIQRDWKD